MITAILKALAAAFNVWQQERGLRNSPELIKNKLDTAKQEAKDALNQAEAVLANSSSTPEEHRKALEAIRLAGS